MATRTVPNLHTQAGARWLAPFMAAFVLTMIAAFVMMLYPHVG